LYPILTVEEAVEQVLSMFSPLEPERVPILEALGRVLAEDVYAEGDIPPHSNSAMDGYALLAWDTVGATRDDPKRLQVIENLAAGYVTDTKVEHGTAIRIMTGAPVPPGADAVIRFERTDQHGKWVDVFYEVAPGQNIRLAGEDVRAGDLVLRKGTQLRPQEIGMLASLGRTDAMVIRRPRVAILATGDEVVEIDQPLAPGKIRNSNSYSNAAQVLKYGGEPLMLGVARDQLDDLTAKIQSGLERGADLLLTSGGVSVGDFDVVKKVLAAEGEITFWRVRMKPGKPLAFGHIDAPSDGGRRSVPVLGMPGNPVSVMVSFEIFARPAILKMLGLTDLDKQVVTATLTDPIPDKDDRRHYVRVHVRQGQDGYVASLTGEQGSGILNSMVRANGLAIIPETWSSAQAGATVRVILLE
jgi:molybdopterin molybdotransferase